jgi:hypothetical protein
MGPVSAAALGGLRGNTPYLPSEVLGRFMASCSQVEVEVAQRFEKERLSIIKPSHC